MNIEFRGKDIEFTEAMKSFIEGKLSRFNRYLKEAGEDQIETIVTLSSVRSKHKDFAGESHPTMYRVDLDIYLKTVGGGAIHAWEEDPDVFTALDKVLDEVERQLIKLKQRRLELRRKSAKIKEEMHTPQPLPPEERERPLIVEEELSIEKPMSVEDAIMELKESGAFFIPFVDMETGELRIAYRKKGGNYGIINTKCKAGSFL